MAPKRIAFEASAIVVKGAFNPAIFSPHWLHDQSLIGDKELEKQEIELITRDVAAFGAGWLKCNVTTDSFQVTTTEPEEYERLRDLAVGVLKALQHTPIAALGLNRDFHLSLGTVDELHAIGDALAPKDLWTDALATPGMRSLVMWGGRPDQYEGRIQVTVEPSNRFPVSVFVSYNDHFALTLAPKDRPHTREHAWDLDEDQVKVTAEKIPTAISVMTEEWIASMKRSEALLDLVARCSGS